MFASSTWTEHLLRGLIGIAAFVGAFMMREALPWLSLALLPLGLVALRGCPMCWTVGLIELGMNKMRGRTDQGLRARCTDGSCARLPR